MQGTLNLSVRARVFADILSLSLIVLGIQYYYNYQGNLFTSANLLVLIVSLCCWHFSARFMGLYKDLRVQPFSLEWIYFLKAVILYALLMTFIHFQFLNHYPVARGHLFLHFSLVFVLFPVQKLAIRVVLKRIRNSSQIKRKVLIVGTGDRGMKFYDQYVKENHYGYTLAGFVDEKVSPELNGKYLGKTSELDQVIASTEFDDIIVTLPINDGSQLEKIVSVSEKEGKRVRIIPHYDNLTSGRMKVDTLGTLPIITLRSLPLDVIDNKLYKRVFDIVFSVIVITVLLSWLIPLVGLLIKLSSKGPVFFKQERWGLNNHPITCYKFRTMVVSSRDTDENGTYQQARKNDPRVTKLGAFLRKTSIDELPQFFNVLMGSMSVVGPRPHPVPLNVQSKDLVEKYLMRHWVKPGITGWAQVNGYRGETRKPYLMQKRVEFDVWYMENWTFWLDLQIILQTVVNAVKKEENAY